MTNSHLAVVILGGGHHLSDNLKSHAGVEYLWERMISIGLPHAEFFLA